MTDTERIAELERNIRQLQGALRVATVLAENLLADIKAVTT